MASALEVVRQIEKPSRFASSQLAIGDVAYWDVRYQEEAKAWLQFEMFDWYAPFSILYPVLESLIINHVGSQRVLIIGVGRSDIIEHLYKLGYRNIVAIDISPSIIRIMSERYFEYTGVEFKVADVRELNIFPDNYFTLIFDKACIDSLFCRSDFNSIIQDVMSELFRVLRQDEGMLMSVSLAQPICRIPYFRKTTGWAIDSTPLLEGESLYLYMATKTLDEGALSKQVFGDAVVMPKSSHITSQRASKMNKGSATKSSGGGGNLSVTESVDVIAELLDENMQQQS